MSDVLRRIARKAGVSPEQCRAVLEAVRDPEPEMVDAGIDASVTCRRNADDAEICVWQAMVDCVLAPDCRTWDTGEQRPEL